MSKEKPTEAPAQEQSAAIVTVKKTAIQLKIDSATTVISNALNECAISVIKHLAPMQQTIQMATGIAALRSAMTDEIVKELFLPLRGTKLGFRTDRDKSPDKPEYGIEVVRDVAIEALIQGAYMTGNEVNIISGGAYFTKEFFSRKVMEWPELTELRVSPGLPTINSAGDGAAVPIEISWRVNGVPDTLSCTIQKDPSGQTVSDRRVAVKLNKGQGTDAAIGKARRKALAMVYERLQGTRWVPADGDALEAEGTPVGEFQPAQAQPASAGAQPAAGTAQGMQDLLNRVKPAGATGAAAPAPAEDKRTDAEKMAAEVAENERLEREALQKENEK